jgi:hypothetical protein
LDAAFDVSQEEVDSGFSFAYRRLARLLDDRRAFCCRVDGPFGPVHGLHERGLCRALQERERLVSLPVTSAADCRPDRGAGAPEEYFGPAQGANVLSICDWSKPRFKTGSATARNPAEL